MAIRPPLSSHPIRAARRQRHERLLATRSIQDSLISVAGLISGKVYNQSGEEVGTAVDLVARWDGEEPYPPVTGFLVKVGHRLAFVGMDQIDDVSPASVRLRSARLDLRDYARREGEVMLGRDVIDHQLIDIDGVQVIRAADLYLAWVTASSQTPAYETDAARQRSLRLVGVDVSAQTLLRRLGPRRWRDRATPERVIDWGAIQPFQGEVPNVRLRASSEALRRLRPGELADILEDLGRPGRQELLASLEPEQAADALEEMDPDELGALLRETPTEQAAALLANMEPDEAVDALRDLDEEERSELLNHLDDEPRELLSELLEYREDRAGGFMTTSLVTATADERVFVTRSRLRAETDHRGDIDAIAIVNDDGIYVDDVGLFALAIADADQTLGELLDEPDPVTVGPHHEVDEVAARLIESRRSSVVVVDDEGRPLGRILADDIVDALMPERSRFHFPRLLT
jgi:hypothetical protein